ncbi:MAG: hypothetical protein WB392_03610 [Methanotrichaceae archaeon]
MKKIFGPIGIMLMGTIFICLLIGLSTAENTADPLSKIKEFHSDFVNHKQDTTSGELVLSGDTMYFPWASQQPVTFDDSFVMPRSKPTKETICMNCTNSEAQLSDLKAMNSVKQRDVTYEDYQRKDQNSKSLVNSMNANVFGGKGKKEAHSYDLDNNSLEKHIDDAVASAMNKAYGTGADGDSGKSHPGNYMNIDVSGITVSAINTVAGGSAVATSNIIIKPVQVIIYPSEVDEKLK